MNQNTTQIKYPTDRSNHTSGTTARQRNHQRGHMLPTTATLSVALIFLGWLACHLYLTLGG